VAAAAARTLCRAGDTTVAPADGRNPTWHENKFRPRVRCNEAKTWTHKLAGELVQLIPQTAHLLILYGAQTGARSLSMWWIHSVAPGGQPSPG